MRRQDGRHSRSVPNPSLHEPAVNFERDHPPRRATAKVSPVLMVGLLAAGFLSYAVVLGAERPLAPLLPAMALPTLAVMPTAATPPRANQHAHYLVRSTLMALDDAHRTGNYVVLRQLASPAFQAANSADRLADAFAAQRRQDLDLSVAALTLPEWSHAPAVGSDNLLRLAGSYDDTRSGRLTFALVFAADGGGWKLYEIHVGQAPKRPGAVQAAGLR